MGTEFIGNQSDTIDSGLKRSNESGMGQRKNIFAAPELSQGSINVKSAHFQKGTSNQNTTKSNFNSASAYSHYVGR